MTDKEKLEVYKHHQFAIDCILINYRQRYIDGDEAIEAIKEEMKELKEDLDK